jgi:hypothetical protein
MEIVAIIATIILVATLLTLIFSFAAYFVTRAKKLLPKKSSKPENAANEGPATRIYFKRYMINEPVSGSGRKAPGEADQWM